MFDFSCLMAQTNIRDSFLLTSVSMIHTAFDAETPKSRFRCFMIEVSISVIEKAWETPTSLNHIFEVKEFDFVIWRYSKGDYVFPDYVKKERIWREKHPNPDFGFPWRKLIQKERCSLDVEYAKTDENNANVDKKDRTPKSGFRRTAEAPKSGFRRLGNPDFGAHQTPKSGFRCLGDLKTVFQ